MRSWVSAWLVIAWLVVTGCEQPAEQDDQPMQQLTTVDSGMPPDDAPQDSTGPFESLAKRPCPDDSALTYESFGGPFFLDYCQGCHGSGRKQGERQMAPLAVAFDDVESIRMQAEAIWRRAADQNRTMPPVGGPPDAVRTQLGEWLACGAPTRAER